MIVPLENLTQILIVLVLATAAVIIVKRDILSLIKTYALQSLLLAIMALLFFLETGSLTLLILGLLILVSKVLVIPHFMGLVQKRSKHKTGRQIPLPLSNNRFVCKHIYRFVRLPLILEPSLALESL